MMNALMESYDIMRSDLIMATPLEAVNLVFEKNSLIRCAVDSGSD